MSDKPFDLEPLPLLEQPERLDAESKWVSELITHLQQSVREDRERQRSPRWSAASQPRLKPGYLSDVVPEPQPTPPKPEGGTNAFLIVVLLASIVMNLVFVLPKVWPDNINILPDDRKKGPDIEGVAVLVLEDEQVNPRERWSPSQSVALDSIVKWARENAGELEDGGKAWVSVDRSQSMNSLDPVWREIVDLSEKSPPTVLVVKDKRVTEFQVPEDPDKAVELLEEAAK